MARWEIELRGLRETQRQMQRTVRDMTGGPMLDAIRKSTLLVQRAAKKNAPVNTGRLRASIVPEVRSEDKAVLGIVGSNLEYAPYMELGTGTPAGNAPHRPPSDALARWAVLHGMPASMGFVIARAIGRRGGLEPRRFMRDAFEANQDRIFRLLDAATGRAVRGN